MALRASIAIFVALLLAAVFAKAVTIVVSFPAYDSILKAAFPNADLILLTKGASDPHEYQLTASDLELLRSLNESDVVVLSMHAPFEFKIAEMAKNGEIKAKVINLTAIQSYLTYDGRLTAYGPGVNPHDHGVFPPNVFKLVEAVSKATGLSPDEHFLNQLRELNATYCCRFSGKAVALTPAAQYLLYWLGYRDIVVVVKDPEVPPSPEDVQKALQYAKEGAPVVAVLVSGESARIIDQFVQKAKEQGITPKVVVVDLSRGYISALKNFTAQMSAIAMATTTATTTPAVADIWLISATLVAVAVVAAVVFLALKRSR